MRVGMGKGTFAEFLAGLDEAALVDLLGARPDVRVEPVPRGFTQLAQRLGGPDSLVAAMRGLNRDTVVVGQAIAALGAAATETTVARLLGAPEPDVRRATDDLCGRGLAWTDSGALRLPERLAAHWSAEIGGGRPAATIARTVLVEDLRATVEALGVDGAGLRKPELVTRLVEVLADARAMAAVVAGLPGPARERFDQLRHGRSNYYSGYDVPGGPGGRARATADRALVAAGLALRVNGRCELPWEASVAAWLAERNLLLTGRPDIRHVEVAPATVRTAAQAAIQELLGAVTALLDQAGSTPITALKKGGVGPRERSRLAARLSVPADVLLMCVDLAHAAGLLGRADAGYAPTEAYPAWRAAEPGHRWATLVTAWFGLDHAPTCREIAGDREQPPPLPLASGAGSIRRAVLRAASGGRSVGTAGEHIDWFFPLHGYPGPECGEKVAAAIGEGTMLGVVALDVLTEYGEALLAVAGTEPEDPAGELAGRVASSLPAAPGAVILQSDLTAVVSGQPGPAVWRLLEAAAVREARGTAAVWRFTPASVRAALDAGWTAAELRTELAELARLSDRPVPQPLEYLVTDVARRHGQVRVRGMRSCVLADEVTTTEILHTRSLNRLHLARLAPTVLSSPYELDEVLARLRAAGLSPVAEDALGVVIVETRREHRAPGGAPAAVPATRPGRLGAADLAARLMADPRGEAAGAGDSPTFDRLASLNDDLDEAELVLLSDAVDNQHDVLITYRDRNGSLTVRAIRPQQVYGRWLDSWCHLRNGQRDFTVANIEAVAPVG
ncbi:MAG TPA: helicase-associated domain-containing protein [Mycobacteriales bacterium]|nr:helicase-associated domain-containing protein [Mycobacteriales bacterium]